MSTDDCLSNRTSSPMDDDRFFIGYCETHSETERALFSKAHVVRILKLAGHYDEADCVEKDIVGWYNVYSDVMHPLCTEARNRLNSPQLHLPEVT